ncbi:11442_t:CDS:2 [Funneliformis geosporum]|nr:11442_t:CDS:2 [Funneliformis geosporum]
MRKNKKSEGIYNQYLIPYRMNSHNLFPTDLNGAQISMLVFVGGITMTCGKTKDHKRSIRNISKRINKYKLIRIRQINDRNCHLFPRDWNGNKIPSLEIWPFANCAKRIRGLYYPIRIGPFNQITNYRCTEKRIQANTQELPNLSDLVEKQKNGRGEICAIMECTCELIPVEEFIRRAYEDVDKLMANFDDEIIFSVEN